MTKMFHLLTGSLLLSVVACADLSAGDADEGALTEAADSSELENPAAEVNAATGGCSGATPISACISRSGSNALGDFYMNARPDTSYWSYTVDITRSNLGTRRVASGRLDHQGHYGAWALNILTSPTTHGCATTVVKVYTSSGTFHLSNTSPQVCW